MLQVFELMNTHIARSEVMAVWRKEGKSDSHFRWVYKRLKDKLLRGILSSSFHDFEDHEKRRINCWLRFVEVKIILISDKRTSAVKLAAEVMREAEKCGLTMAAFSLAQDLANNFGVLNVDLGKYRRYRRKERMLWEELSNERKAQELFTELGFLDKKKREYEHLEQQVKAMSMVKSDSSKFNLFRFSLMILWHQKKENHLKIIETCTAAISYFEKAKTSLPYTTKWYFYMHMIPYLIANQDFGTAEIKIKSCLSLPAEGSYNWHISMLQLAMLGFRSDKPRISYQAWKEAMKHETDSDAIKESWEIVYAYLAIYEKLGRLELEPGFRLARYMNSVGTSRLSVQVSVMLHLLLDGRHGEYMKQAYRVPDVLKKEKSARGRCFLRMLAKVDKGDYYKIRVSAMAKRDWSTLRRTARPVSLKMIDDEVIDFETLWAIVIERLR